MTKKEPSCSLTVKHGGPINQSVTIRNLQPQDLGAVIFGCTNNTFAECHTRQLFGLPRTHLSYVQNIKEGLPLFLFNYDDRRLHGIYEAASNGKFCPQSNAWSRNAKEKTRYPAQVAMRIKWWCSPLAEIQFRNAILTNYYQRMPGVIGQMRHFFHFELDHAQTRALMNIFTPLPAPYNFWTSPAAAPVHEHVSKSTLPPVCTLEFEGNSAVKSEKALKPYADVQKEKLEEVEYVCVNAEPTRSGFSGLDCGDTPSEGRDNALSNKDAKLQQQQSGQQDKKLSLELEKFKVLSPHPHSSAFFGNANATADIDKYSCKDAQKVKSNILDGPSNLAENFNAEVDRLSLGHSNPPVQSLDFKSCAKPKDLNGVDCKSHAILSVLEAITSFRARIEASKMMNTRCTVVNQLSASPPALIQQFQETEAQYLAPAVYETKNNNNDNGALEATDPAGHPQTRFSESTSIWPLTMSSSQKCMRDENSPRKGRKRKTATLAIQRRPNGQDEIHNTHPTELQSPDYISWYVKDKLIGKITCMVCGEEGHHAWHCPMKDRENKVMCTMCNKVGHCYLWCCRQHVSGNRACRRCGETGHYTNKDLSHCDEKYTNMYVRCSSCDDSHPLGRCPMGKVTCFLCEGKDHVPAHCRLSPMLTITQCSRESFQAILKQALAETSRRAVQPAKPSSELKPHDDSHKRQFKTNHVALMKKVLTRSACFNCHEEGHYVKQCPNMKLPGELELHGAMGDCERKNSTKNVLYSDQTNHAALTEKILTRRSSSACFNCHEEGHYVRQCPNKKPPGKLDDVTCFKFRANRCHKKKPTKLELCDVTCFYCHDKGHYSYSCPVNKPPGGLELHDVTCINFDANRCDGKKPPGELLCDITCFTCNEKGHYSYSCPQMNHLDNAMVDTMQKASQEVKKEQQKQNDGEKLLD